MVETNRKGNDRHKVTRSVSTIHTEKLLQTNSKDLCKYSNVVWMSIGWCRIAILFSLTKTKLQVELVSTFLCTWQRQPFNICSNESQRKQSKQYREIVFLCVAITRTFIFILPVFCLFFCCFSSHFFLSSGFIACSFSLFFFSIACISQQWCINFKRTNTELTLNL